MFMLLFSTGASLGRGIPASSDNSGCAGKHGRSEKEGIRRNSLVKVLLHSPDPFAVRDPEEYCRTKRLAGILAAL
jgi:hypothetical protein